MRRRPLVPFSGVSRSLLAPLTSSPLAPPDTAVPRLTRRQFCGSLLALAASGALLDGMLAPSSFAGQRVGSLVPSHGCVPDEVLIRFHADTPASIRAALHRAVGATVRDQLTALGVEVVALPPGVDPYQAAAVYSRSAGVEFAEPNYLCSATATPNDPLFGQQWGLTRIQAPQAWDFAQGSEGVPIAILDSGIDQDHEDLAAKIVANRNFTDSNSVDDVYGHGTHTAGIAAAITDNGIGVAGVGNRCSLMNVKVLGDDHGGRSSWIAQGIAWAADAGARVISMSFGSAGNSQTVQNAVEYAWSRGAVLVASAGFGGSSAPNYPGAYEQCIAVASTDPADQKDPSSNQGPWVDVAAPGINILSTLPNHPSRAAQLNYGTLSGTSQATAFVAGLAGLVWSSGFGGSNAAVRDRIEATCDAIAGTGTFWTHGRINAARAVGA